MEKDGGEGAKVVRDIDDVCPCLPDEHRANTVRWPGELSRLQRALYGDSQKVPNIN